MEVTTLMGSVEIAPRLGMADGICDLVSTGGTLKENNLREVKTIFKSQAVLIKSLQRFSEEKNEIANIFQKAIKKLKITSGGI